MSRVVTIFCAATAFLLLLSDAAYSDDRSEFIQPEVAANATTHMSTAPLAFTKNMGQWPDSILFRADAGGATAWFTSTGVIYQFTRRVPRAGELDAATGDMALRNLELGEPTESGSEPMDSIETMLVRASFVDANPDAEVVGEGLMEYKCNYFIGNDPAKWRTDVPNYRTIELLNIYDKVHLKFYCSIAGELAYQYLVENDADAAQVTIEYERIEGSLSFGEEASVQTAWGVVCGLVASPDAANQTALSCGLGDPPQTRADGSVGLVYSTYLEGSLLQDGYGIAIDGMGCAFVTGKTHSADFPVQNAYDPSLSGPSMDVFVTKLSAEGTSIIYSTFLGGSSERSIGLSEYGADIAVDAFGCAYVTGMTTADDFPVHNAYDPSHNGWEDVFLAKLSSEGNSLIYSTYLGAESNERGSGITVNEANCAHVTGCTSSSMFPTQSAYDASYNGGKDAFVAKFTTTGTELIYSTYLGGPGDDVCGDISIDGMGNTYVRGYTTSTGFPTQNAYDDTYNGGDRDITLTKLSNDGSALIYSTLLGGSASESGGGLTVDGSGCAYVAGRTYSPDFPVENAFDPSFNGMYDAYITKFSAAGNTVVYSTFLGGMSSDYASGVSVGDLGCLYVTGTTSSSDFPTQSAFDESLDRYCDVFVTEVSPSGQALMYSTFLGGSGHDYGEDIAVDSSGNAFVIGHTASPDFPIVSAYDSIYGSGGSSVFVTKLGPGGFIPDDPAYQSRFTITISSPASLQVIGCMDDTYSTDCYDRTSVLWSGNCQPPGCGTLTGTGVIPAGVRKLMFYWWEQGSMLFPGYAIGAIRYEDGCWKVVNLSAWANLYIQAKSGQEELLIPQVADTSASGEDLYTLIILEDWVGSGQPIQDTYSVVDGTCGEIPGLLVSTTPIEFDSLAGPGDDPFLATPYTGTVHLIAETSLSPGCCLDPSVGDIDQSGGVDITDISVLIDNQFLSLTPLLCEAEGDVDFSGTVDITDLSVLIDNQFLTLTPLPPCP